MKSLNLRKISILFTLSLLVLTSLTAVSLIVFTSRLNSAAGGINIAMESVRAAEEIQVHLLNHSRKALLFGLGQDPVHDETRRQQEVEISRWLEISRRFADSDLERELINETETAIRSYLQAYRALNRAGGTAIETYLAVNAELELAFEKAGELTDLNTERARQLESRAQTGSNIANVLGVVVGIFCLIIAPLGLIVSRWWIHNPIRNLHQAIRSFSGSDSAHPVQVPEEGPEEMRAIGSAFNELTERLITQREARIRFLAAVAHDLRNPLSAIRMSVELLTSEELPKDEQVAMAEIIGRQALQLERMVGDLLDSTQIEAGQLVLQKSKQNVRTIFEDAVSLHKSLSAIHHLSVHSEKTDIFCECDPLRVGQIANNLLSNAIKYSPNGGQVRVEISTEGPLVIVRVRDEGIGIAADDLNQVFEPFRRTKMTKLSIPGVGLGLSVTRRIIQAHGGTIDIESTPGQGSTFIVRLSRWTDQNRDKLVTPVLGSQPPRSDDRRPEVLH